MFKREERAMFTGYQRIWTINFICLAVFIYSVIIKAKANVIGIPVIQATTTKNLYSSSLVILVISLSILMFKYVFPKLKEHGKDSKYLLVLLGLIGVFIYRTLDKLKNKGKNLQNITEDMTPLEKEQIEHAIKMQNNEFKYSLIALIVLLLVLFFAYRHFIFGTVGKMTVQISIKALAIVFGLIIVMNLYTYKQSFNEYLQYSIEFEKYKLFISISAFVVLVALTLVINKTKIKIPTINFKKKAPVVENVPTSNHDYLKGKKIAVAMDLWNEREDISFYDSKNKKHGTYSAYTEKTEQGLKLVIENAPVGLTKLDLMRKSENYKQELGAMVVKDLDSDLNKKLNDKRENSKYKIEFITENPLNEAWIVKSDSPIRLDEDDMTVYPYRDIDGNIGTLSFKEVSGMVIGGLPGSGKTAGMTSFMLPLALSNKVKLTIIDGKGGYDWDIFKDISEVIKYDTNPLEDTDNLDEILEVLTDVLNDGQNRLKRVKSITGSSNFWHSPVSPKMPFRVVVIDEVQVLFETVGRSREDLQKIDKINRVISTIVRKYRSVGICVIMATQKPSADSLPTNIRDNTTLRIAFRLGSSASEIATLGSGLDESPISAQSIPQANKGMAVLADEKGLKKYVRFGYMPEKEIEKAIKNLER